MGKFRNAMWYHYMQGWEVVVVVTAKLSEVYLTFSREDEVMKLWMSLEVKSIRRKEVEKWVGH